MDRQNQLGFFFEFLQEAEKELSKGRYCTFLVTGNGIYCTRLNKEISEKRAKSVNKCNCFNLNSIDAFGENEKGYTPREPKQKECSGQLSLF